MSEFLQRELGQRDVCRVEKNPISKNKCDLSKLEGKKWKVSSESRGKEMILTFSSTEEVHKMKVSFGRVGSISYYNLGEIDETEFEKKAMLRLYTEDKVYFLSDFTRYAVWRWSGEWDANRSPDMLIEHNKWRSHIYKHRKSPYFKRPLYEILIDQRFFNGLGNFTRTEILCRTRFSPFIHFNEVLESDILREDFFLTCKETLEDIHSKGGLQFKHWKNPDNVSKQELNDWIRCYNKRDNAFYLRDPDGRKFWFEKKWVHEYMNLVKTEEVQDTRLLEKIYSKIKSK